MAHPAYTSACVALARASAAALSLAQAGIFKLSNAASPIEVFEFDSRKRINSVYGLAKFGFKDFFCSHYIEIITEIEWHTCDNTSLWREKKCGSELLHTRKTGGTTIRSIYKASPPRIVRLLTQRPGTKRPLLQKRPLHKAYLEQHIPYHK